MSAGATIVADAGTDGSLPRTVLSARIAIILIGGRPRMAVRERGCTSFVQCAVSPFLRFRTAGFINTTGPNDRVWFVKGVFVKREKMKCDECWECGKEIWWGHEDAELRAYVSDPDGRALCLECKEREKDEGWNRRGQCRE